MVGLPGSGKTYWAKNHCDTNLDKRYNILSTGALFDKMKVSKIHSNIFLFFKTDMFNNSCLYLTRNADNIYIEIYLLSVQGQY